MNSELTVDDSQEASETALLYIEALAFFVGNPDTVVFNDENADDLRGRFNLIGELITQLLSVALWHLDEIETRRKDLESLLCWVKEKIPENPENEVNALLKKIREKRIH